MENIKNRIASENITSLKSNEVFVFGSNLAGRHGGGAARLALEKFGAIYGQSTGHQGQSWAIPTKDFEVRFALSLEEIQKHIDSFIFVAKNTPNLTYLVTEIGCGLAGLSVKDVAPLFKEAINIPNIKLPFRFWLELGQLNKESIYMKKYLFNINSIKINQHVYHDSIYNGNEGMIVMGMRSTNIPGDTLKISNLYIELAGDYSGGTQRVIGSSWLPLKGTFVYKKVCLNELNPKGCQLHNIHCNFPDCEGETTIINSETAIIISDELYYRIKEQPLTNIVID